MFVFLYAAQEKEVWIQEKNITYPRKESNLGLLKMLCIQYY